MAADDGPPPDFEVWPQNWDAFRLFAAAGTQWERAGMAGVRVGLKYEILDFVAAKIGVDLRGDVFERLRAAESAALEYWSEKTP